MREPDRLQDLGYIPNSLSTAGQLHVTGEPVLRASWEVFGIYQSWHAK